MKQFFDTYKTYILTIVIVVVVIIVNRFIEDYRDKKYDALEVENEQLKAYALDLEQQLKSKDTLIDSSDNILVIHDTIYIRTKARKNEVPTIIRSLDEREYDSILSNFRLER